MFLHTKKHIIQQLYMTNRKQRKQLYQSYYHKNAVYHKTQILKNITTNEELSMKLQINKKSYLQHRQTVFQTVFQELFVIFVIDEINVTYQNLQMCPVLSYQHFRRWSNLIGGGCFEKSLKWQFGRLS